MERALVAEYGVALVLLFPGYRNDES